jgi:DNA-binding CsgD family transcriptional regulator
MTTPQLRVEPTGEVHPLTREVTTVGRGDGVDIALSDPSVSRLHAELVRRGPHLYVADLGLSTNGTRVNGRPVTRRVLADGDVLGFGNARARVDGVGSGADETVRLRDVSAPALTPRESEVLAALCQPALRHEAFVAPGTAKDIADELVVTEAAVKQHLLRLYQKFRIAEGPSRRNRLANEVIATGVIRPMPATGEGKVREVRRAG